MKEPPATTSVSPAAATYKGSSATLPAEPDYSKNNHPQAPEKFDTWILRMPPLELHLIHGNGLLWHCTFSPARHEEAGHRLAHHWPAAAVTAGKPPAALLAALTDLAGGRQPEHQLRYCTWFPEQGTELQQKVWRLLLEIPRGQTRTYGELAARLGNPRLARAVGRACNRNPLALVIPCHRVVGKNNAGGFAGGLHIKQLLLSREKTSCLNPCPCGHNEISEDFED